MYVHEHEVLHFCISRFTSTVAIRHFLWPELLHFPLSGRLIICVLVAVSFLKVKLLDLFRLDHHNPEVLAGMFVLKILNLHALLVMLVIIRLALGRAWWGCSERTCNSISNCTQTMRGYSEATYLSCQGTCCQSAQSTPFSSSSHPAFPRPQLASCFRAHS